jgi:hypothetical protein
MGASTVAVEPDFSGWASKASIKCGDGRTIMPDAFKHQDKQTVPLVWQHMHNDPENVLGHAVLEARPEGVYAHAFFNDTPKGLTAKALVQHGDVESLSIFANKLIERSKQVFHGIIREVSLVLSGANPGAVIENVAVAHSDGEVETIDDEAVIYMGTPIEYENDEVVEHADGDDKTVQDVFDSFTEEQKQVVYYMIGAAVDAASSGSSAAQSAVNDDDGQHNLGGTETGTTGETSNDPSNGTIEHQDPEEGITMANVFENQNGGGGGQGASLTHSQLQTIVEDAKKMGSFKDSFLKHAVEYGIENIDVLFPEARAISNSPELIARRQEWVNKVLGGTRKTPFSRIKTVSADITLEQARAKGYVKGNLKKEEWFTLARRITTPTTIYKKQKLDRDDIIDITDLDVVAFLKGEMRLMLDEEIARAILVGDGREVDDDDKINEGNIRPIAHDDDFFSHRVVIPANTGSEGLIESMLRSRTKYRGSGQPTLYCTEDLLTDMLLGKDKMGRRYYKDMEELRTALRVADIVTPDVMEDQTADGGDLLAVIVNMTDYTVGADRGGQVSMFDDFDIDYNQYKYLIETRMSGALTKFKSALVFVRSAGTMVEPTVPTFNAATGVVTIPATTGVVYTNGDTNAVLTAGAQPAINAGESIEVVADPADGYYFPHNTDNDWTFTRNV